MNINIRSRPHRHDPAVHGFVGQLCSVSDIAHGAHIEVCSVMPRSRQSCEFLVPAETSTGQGCWPKTTATSHPCSLKSMNMKRTVIKTVVYDAKTQHAGPIAQQGKYSGSGITTFLSGEGVQRLDWLATPQHDRRLVQKSQPLSCISACGGTSSLASAGNR